MSELEGVFVSYLSKQHTTGATPGLQPCAGVVARDMGSAAVLIHLESNRIFELNATGARVWALVEQRLSRDAIVDCLRREFAAGDDLEETVDELLDGLRREGLLDG